MTDPLNPVADFLASIPKPVRKPKPRRRHVERKHDYKDRYTEARKIMFQRDCKAAWDAGHYFDKVVPDINKTNGFQNYIQDVLNNLGHLCERVNTTGIYTKGGWRRSGSTKGSSDLHITLQGGKAWKIEIKSGKDDLSPSQEKYRDRSLAAGALHSTIYVGDTDMFWDELEKYTKI